MNLHRAYQTCHELMLVHPKYVPTEGSEVSYVLIQVSETDETIGICGHIIDPAVPLHGSPERFLSLPLHKQIVLFTLDKLNKTMRDAGKFLDRVNHLRKPGETDQEFLERIKNKLETETKDD
jgi:hypothetical protein